MKKRTPPADAGVSGRTVAAGSISSFRPAVRKTYKCRVCDEPGASDDSEGLCWVCRRLKISAWKEIETQLPAGE